MRWEEMLLDLFEDLEQQAEGLHLAERDAEVADRSRAEYAAHVDFASRIHASVGSPLILAVVGVGALEGSLRSAGVDWCLVEADHEQEWVVRLAAVAEVRGVSDRALSEPVRPVVARLGFGSAMRRIADARSVAVVHRLDGSQSRGSIARVGVDFLELVPDEDESEPVSRRASRQASRRRQAAQVVLVPFGQVAAVRRT